MTVMEKVTGGCRNGLGLLKGFFSCSLRLKYLCDVLSSIFLSVNTGKAEMFCVHFVIILMAAFLDGVSYCPC